MALVTLLVVVVFFSTPTPVAAQGSQNLSCGRECAFFRMLISIPTTGDPAADLAGLLALASTLLTMARLSQASRPLPLEKVQTDAGMADSVELISSEIEQDELIGVDVD
ncbi:MAG: hypothetical protein U0528_19340 [Anaerolineae bacterium]